MSGDRFLVIGITGSIGMGKSAVTRMVEKEGYYVFNADKVVHKLLGIGGAAVSLISEIFPQSYHRNRIDRKVLGSLVLNNPHLLKKLERIIHPLVWEEMEAHKKYARINHYKGLVCDIPLLFETKADKKCDITICVFSRAQVQRERVLKRKNMTKKKFQSIKKSQLSDIKKKEKADFIIRTDTTLRKTRDQVCEVLSLLSRDVLPNKQN